MNSELFIAAKEGKIGSLRSALNSGISIDDKNSEGQTPLMIACKEGHAALVRFILSKSPDIDITDNNGRTVVDYIKESNCDELIDMITVKEEDKQVEEQPSNKFTNLADKLLSLFQQLVPLVHELDETQKDILKRDFIKIVQLFHDETELTDLDIMGLGLTEVLFHYADEMETYFKNIKKAGSIDNFVKEIYEVQKENYLSNATSISNFHLESLTAFGAYSKIIDSDQLKRILYEFAEIMAKADDIVTTEESEKLKFLSKSLFKSTEIGHEPIQTSALNLEEILEEVNELVGMDNIKDDIKSLINILNINKLREKEGLPKQSISHHSVFIGAPGTGKTTIARILAKIYTALGVLSENNFVETDRSGLVAGYLGQTAIKTENIVNQALNGVLFIDEAYALKRKNSQDEFGQEAIDILLKRMEDHRENLIIIVAGYEVEMNDFINSNPGLKSRFNRYFHFKDYIPSELTEIYIRMAKKSGFNLTKDAENKLKELFELKYNARDGKFGNARLSRNVFEKTFESHANRTAVIAPITREILTTIEVVDIPFDTFKN